MTFPVGQPRLGRVTAFDDARGLGTVTSEDGDAFSFHCTALTDGTRTVTVGTKVVFEVTAGHLGRLEARAVSTVT